MEDIKNFKSVLSSVWYLHRKTVARINVLEKALKEIRDVAAVSEDVAFYAMLAEKALDPETMLTEEDFKEGPWLP